MISTAFMSGPCALRKPRCAGVTLVELLVTLLIAGIAFFALAVPFFSERSFWRQGERQTEAQRNAQVGLRALARSGRESSGHNLVVGTSSNTITFSNVICPGPDGIRGTPDDFTISQQFTGNPGGNGKFQMDSCSGGPPVDFIDGNRTRVTFWQATAVTARLVRVRMQVTQKGEKNELLETEIYLRNA